MALSTPEPDPQFLLSLVRTRMPFGRYQGRLLVELPEAYLAWFSQRGFPKSKLGRQLQSLYEIYQNGLGAVLKPLVEQQTNHLQDSHHSEERAVRRTRKSRR